MKRPALLLFFFFCSLPFAFCQSAYWQQQADYIIDVRLNDKDHTLDGFAKIDYYNNSPDTLKFIWFHLWPNAYKNDKTAFSDQLLENGKTKFYFSSKDEKGYINRLEFKVNNLIAVVEDHPEHIDIVKLILPSPLSPGGKINITTPFHVKLPFNFSRGGHDGTTYQVTQWYPKPAVYDKDGWHPMPYLDQGEFYSEFGKYDVRITLPPEYIVASTGILKDSSNYITGTKTLQFQQDNIHDFAWFANTNFIKESDSLKLRSGRIIQVSTYYTSAQKSHWAQSLETAKQAILFYSDEVGEYPYDIVSVVQGPESFGGGMEYPTITVISPGGGKEQLAAIIAHEIGHNWFYGILATNERLYPWMDEGMNSYYEKIFTRKFKNRGQLEKLFFETKAATRTDQPIATRSEQFTKTNYSLIPYYKTAEWLSYLELQIGKEKFSEAMQAYYQRWKFRHPQPGDFQAVMENVTGKDLDAVFALQQTKGLIPFESNNRNKLTLAVTPKAIADYYKSPGKNLVMAGPAAGFNNYDKLMAGIFVSNLKLPPSKLLFFVSPFYATGSKTFAGIGFINYSFYPDNFIKSISVSASGSKFSMDRFTDPDGNKLFFSFQKLVPKLRLTFQNKNPRSHISRYIQFKSFLITEDRLSIRRDSVITPIDTTLVTRYLTVNDSRTLNQIEFVIQNNRVLYPYKGELKIEQGKDFVRAGFTGNYFFNYPKNGGLHVRLFAGKFIYPGSKTVSKQFATDRYHLNLTGPNGYEDYTYSDYFIGRNLFEGFASQQIMTRDGGFKVRTELLADKVGKTDDWLMALNLNTTVPNQFNPLSLLPVKIPLHLFLDIGTYAETWEQEAESDRFLYDFGIHVPLLQNTINIYIPLLYSRVYKDYIQSTIEKKGRFFKTISFSIDLTTFNGNRIKQEIVTW